MKLKKIWLYPMLSAATLSLAACGNEEGAVNEAENTNGEGSDNVEEVEITYARGADSTGSTDKIIEAFEEEFPHIKINFLEMPNSSNDQHSQYVTTFGAQSTEIDVFDGDVVWPAEFAQANYVLELDRFIERDGIDMDEYFSGTVDSGNFDGRQWAMPKYTDAGLLYYRTDIIDEVPETWEELDDAASNATEGDINYGYVLQASQYEGLVVNAMEFIASYGGQVVDENNEVVVNSPETIKGLEKMVEVITSDYVPSNILNFEETETETAFVEGHTAMARNWPYMSSTANDEEVSQIAGNVGYAQLPAGDAGSAATLGGFMTMINRHTEHAEEAWEFVKFMTGEEGQTISAVEGGRAPTLEYLYEEEEIQQSAPIFQEEVFVETLQNAVPRPVTPIYAEVSDILQVELSRALTQDITVEEAVENIESKMIEALED